VSYTSCTLFQAKKTDYSLNESVPSNRLWFSTLKCGLSSKYSTKKFGIRNTTIRFKYNFLHLYTWPMLKTKQSASHLFLPWVTIPVISLDKNTRNNAGRASLLAFSGHGQHYLFWQAYRNNKGFSELSSSRGLFLSCASALWFWRPHVRLLIPWSCLKTEAFACTHCFPYRCDHHDTAPLIWSTQIIFRNFEDSSCPALLFLFISHFSSLLSDGRVLTTLSITASGLSVCYTSYFVSFFKLYCWRHRTWARILLLI